ncbi:YkgJ family cysteine cluster protein [Akkermansiaceae bacterium]|nr:YkgJ family cysteine cluster protein [Akkermansiaceae bacterium]
MRKTWYQCDRCTACCKWPGDVRVEENEIVKIADSLGMSYDAFVQKHTRLRTNRSGLSLLEKENHECSWLDGDKCLLQEVKPGQCKGFPNQWNFTGWKNECHAKPVPMQDAIQRGFVSEEEASQLEGEI